MSTKVGGSIEKSAQEIVQYVTRDLRNPKFTHSLIQDMNQEHLERFSTICDLFTKYRPVDAQTDDRAGVFARTMQKKNDAFSARQTTLLTPYAKEQLESESETVVTEFWELIPAIHNAALFVQCFQQLVNELKPQPIQFPVIKSSLDKLSKMELPKTITTFHQELAQLQDVQAARFEAAQQLNVYVATTARSIDGVVPEIVRRTGRHEQTVAYGGTPLSSWSPTRMATAYQIRLPKELGSDASGTSGSTTTSSDSSSPSTSSTPVTPATSGSTTTSSVSSSTSTSSTPVTPRTSRSTTTSSVSGSKPAPKTPFTTSSGSSRSVPLDGSTPVISET